jgi:hypothetical protein
MPPILKRLLCMMPLLMMAGDLMAQSGSDAQPMDNDFSPMLFVMMLVLMLACLVAVGIGIVLGVALLAFAGALVSAGILTSSVIVGLVTGRVSAGWRTFLILSSVIVLTVFGATAGWGIEKLSHTEISISWAILIGAAAGALGGVVAAMGFDWILRLAARRASALLELPWVARTRSRFLPRLAKNNHQPATSI